MEGTSLQGLEEASPEVHQQESVLNGQQVEAAKKVAVVEDATVFNAKDSAIIQVIPGEVGKESIEIELELTLDKFEKGKKQVVRRIGDSGKVELGLSLEANSPVLTVRMINQEGSKRDEFALR